MKAHVQLNVRVPPDMAKRLKRAADREQRPISSLVRWWLSQRLEQESSRESAGRAEERA